MNQYEIVNMNDVPIRDVPINYYRHQLSQMNMNKGILSLQCAGTLGNPTFTFPTTVLPDANVTFNLSWSGGVAPYRIVLYRDYGTVGFYDSGQPNNIPGTTSSVTRQLLQGAGWTTGTHTIQAQLHDSCTSAPGGKNVTLSTPQTITISTTPPPPQQTYQCIGNTCQPSTCTEGTLGCYTENTCGGTYCAAPPTTYQCIGNVCQQSACTAGTLGCYTENTCGGTCTVPPPPPTTCNGILIGGSCIPKTYITYGVLAFGAIFLISIVK